ncbi:hypothetical protein D3C80_1724200 [compost metagenome]
MPASEHFGGEPRLPGVSGANCYRTTTCAVRAVPSDDRTVTVGLVVGTTVVVVTDNRQRPEAGTAAVPSVTMPSGVLTCTVMVLPTTAVVVPERSQVKRLLERARTSAAVMFRVSATTCGETCTVTVATPESAPSESLVW